MHERYDYKVIKNVIEEPTFIEEAIDLITRSISLKGLSELIRYWIYFIRNRSTRIGAANSNSTRISFFGSTKEELAHKLDKGQDAVRCRWLTQVPSDPCEMVAYYMNSGYSHDSMGQLHLFFFY
ncbi:hypothetical protein Ccrd_020968 [Cynara cardunculus var. scolymus]|uniref:Uncharacterized protein n=1 Tax=Cynara cardunculus var. scolymus TaxID=59895 RepID=A0A103Y1G2_CYNCS|nr:hypothetical protein Ccrd_020968 [Cynara cardunculus var. scolymus]